MEDRELEEGLKAFLPEDQIKTRYIDRVSFGADAGFYFLLPRAIVRVRSEEEVIQLFRFSHQHTIPLVFRTGGTSLAGQAITDGILVDLSMHWNQIKIDDGGATVRVQPGITGAMVNAYLRKYSRKIGPDPSSISSAMMGGILSNNSSGMCCGVVNNAYHTTKFIRFILPDGNSFNTERKEDYLRFEKECSGIFHELKELRTAILTNNDLLLRIRRKYVTKNTVGYSLNAFVDYEHPLDIMAHLLIGGEGTLAFISEAVLNTLDDYAHKATALLYFPTIYDACTAIVPLKVAGAEAVELMDRASLRSVELMPGMPAVVKTLPDAAAALLVEFQERNQEALRVKVDSFLGGSANITLLFPATFTSDYEEQAFLWKVRKGLFPAVGAVRVSGTTVVLEDIAFPVESLGDAIVDLHKLFQEFDYNNAIIFGHAKDGNLHFVITQSFNTDDEIDRYDRFLRKVVDLVVLKYDGALKAEHGTGRNIAPFVETEWGGEAYAIMKRLKQVIDPRNLLNPGVIINDSDRCHIENIKPLPTVEAEVDKCIECGYCEHKCPSRDLTTTPRRRIVIRRTLQTLKEKDDKVNYQLLLDQYDYDGLETCAVDGLCATACPVDINTGDLIKRLRRENHSAFENRVALFVSRQFRLVERTAKFAIRSGRLLNSITGAGTMTRLTTFARKFIPAVPIWSGQIGKTPALPLPDAVQPEVVYFPACISRLLGDGHDGKPGILETTMRVAKRAGISMTIISRPTGTCCGQIFSSKGFAAAYADTANRIVSKLWEETKSGLLPVVTDVSSCAYTLHQLRPVLSGSNKAKFDSLRILDAVEFLHDLILPRLTAVKQKNSIVLHPVCSLQKMGTEKKFTAVARFFAKEVKVPLHAGCCGMAGDRGFLFPELTAAATAPEAAEVKESEYEGYYSSTKTCEMAMTEAVKKNYESIMYLASEALE